MLSNKNRCLSWKCYNALPESVQPIADENYELLKTNPSHPSLHFKKVRQYWSIRAEKGYRALEVEVKDDISWVWVDIHAENDKLIS